MVTAHFSWEAVPVAVLLRIWVCVPWKHMPFLGQIKYSMRWRLLWSMVSASVSLSICLSVTQVSCARPDVHINILFGVETPEHLRIIVLDGGLHHPTAGGRGFDAAFVKLLWPLCMICSQLCASQCIIQTAAEFAHGLAVILCMFGVLWILSGNKCQVQSTASWVQSSDEPRRRHSNYQEIDTKQLHLS